MVQFFILSTLVFYGLSSTIIELTVTKCDLQDIVCVLRTRLISFVPVCDAPGVTVICQATVALAYVAREEAFKHLRGAAMRGLRKVCAMGEQCF